MFFFARNLFAFREYLENDTVRRFSPKGNFFAELNENLQIVGKIDEIEKAIFVSTQSLLVQEKIEASLTPAIYSYVRAHPFS
jgi:hypothetical protein